MGGGSRWGRSIRLWGGWVPSESVFVSAGWWLAVRFWPVCVGWWMMRGS